MAFAEITGASASSGKAATAAGMPPPAKRRGDPNAWKHRACQIAELNKLRRGQQPFGVINIGLPMRVQHAGPDDLIIRMPTAIFPVEPSDNAVPTEPTPRRVSRAVHRQRRRLFGSGASQTW